MNVNKICCKLAVCIPSILGTSLQRTVYMGPNEMILSDIGYFDDFRHFFQRNHVKIMI